VNSDASAIDSLRGQAHIWLARPEAIKDPKLLSAYRSMLSQEERERQARFLGEAHRHLYLVSHALVRTSLSRYADIPPEQWTFCAGEHGRPEIAAPTQEPRLRFNLSHTVGLVACAVCLEVDCGVDVERVNRVGDLDGVARRVFSESERADLNRLEGRARQGRFTDYWSLKEAYIKARGTGFQLAPRTFSIRLGDATGNSCSLEFGENFDDCAKDWQLALLPVDPGTGQEFRLAIALHCAGRPTLEIVVAEVIPRS
jgi:4'-phosphopantetheinyl transferase